MNTLAGLFQSLGQVNTGATVMDIALTALISVLIGVLIVLFYAILNRRRSFSVEFSVTIIAICSVIALIIAVIGTNIASAFSLAGIMSIVRFRSLQQRPSDIAFIFIAMATGLTIGLGLIVPALVFVLIVGVLLNVFAIVAAKYKKEVRLLKISVPESMSFEGQFDEVLKKYTTAFDLKRVRLISAGTVMEISFVVTMRGMEKKDEFLTAIREKNNNFNVVLMYDEDEAQ
jgi:hypothetical protein